MTTDHRLVDGRTMSPTMRDVDYTYIPRSPVKWLERLLEVNSGAEFSKEDKAEINKALEGLIRKFESND